MYILDTDHLSLIQRDTPIGQSIVLRLANARVAYATTVITYEEQLRGWLDFTARTRNLDEQVKAYQLLKRHAEDYCKIVILEFDQLAAQTNQRLRKAYPRLGAMDLKIAAIALSQNAILLTRNQSDFGKITELRTEDWSR